MNHLLHVTPDQFLHDSFRLGREVYRSGFRPKHVVSIWRGGTPVGLGVDAYFRTRGLFLHHTTIATESYRGRGDQGDVTVKGLEHLVDVVCREDGLLVVDDVLDSGATLHSLLKVLRLRARANAPEDVRVATIHRKPERVAFHEVPSIALYDLPADTWIVYPHELYDLVEEGDPEEALLRAKDEDLWRLLRTGKGIPFTPVEEDDLLLVSPRQLLLDSFELGCALLRDGSFHPDFLVALWPGGVHAGLPVHELYKYHHRKGRAGKAPDHISLNTVSTRGYHSDIVGMHYLVEQISPEDRVLIIDTTFHSGRLVNDALWRLKEALRRNLSLDRVRVASVYFNPEERSTWTVPPTVPRPHYYLREVRKEVVYPQSIHKLVDPQAYLRHHDAALHDLIYPENLR